MSYIAKANDFLADQVVLYVKLHNVHWYVEGKGFFTLHTKFEELYDAVTAVADEVAERILALGAKPYGSLAEMLKATSIKELPSEAVDSEKAARIVLEDFENLAKKSKEIIGLAADAGDDGTADIFTGYLKEYEKAIWMLKAYLK